MAKFPVHDYQKDLTCFLMEKIEETLKDIEIKDVLAGNIKGDTIGIVEAHPVAVIGSSYTTEKGIQAPLPVIGVVLMNENDNDKQILGLGTGQADLSEVDFNDRYSLATKERWKEGIIIGSEDIQAIDDYFTSLPPEAPRVLPVVASKDIREQNFKISIWSHHPRLTRIIWHIMRCVIMQLKVELADCFSILKMNGVGNLSNYDFGMTLYGMDWDIMAKQEVRNLDVDTDVKIISGVETAPAVGDDALDEDAANPTFHVSGRADKYL